VNTRTKSTPRLSGLATICVEELHRINHIANWFHTSFAVAKHKTDGKTIVTSIVGIVRKAYSEHPWLPLRSPLKRALGTFRGSVKVLKSRKRDFELRLRFEGIRSTRPLACNPAAKTQLHVLTCHKHVPMFLTSAKSLLRFETQIAIILHDDGSLTSEDTQAIEHHIKGIRIIRRQEADLIADRAFKDFPRIQAYRAQVINSLELTDHLLIGSSEKLIITNSDTLFLERPDALIEWIAAPAHGIVCVYEEDPHQQVEFLAAVGSTFPPHVTLGLVCFPRFTLDASEIETLLARTYATFDPWFLGQNILPALLEMRGFGDLIQFLDPNAYQASGMFSWGAIYRHYWSSLDILNKQFFADGAEVIAALKKIPAV